MWNPFGSAQVRDAVNQRRLMLGLDPLTRKELRSISFQDVYGQAPDTFNHTTSSLDHALTLTSVYSAISLIADTIASMPLESLQVNKDGTSVVKPGSIKLIEDPTSFGTKIDWTHRIVVSMASRGNAYGYITQRGDDGRARQIEWFHPDDVSIRDNRTIYAPQWYWLGRELKTENFVHIPLFTVPGRYMGVSPIAAYAGTIEQGLLAQAFGRDYFKHGTVPSGILKTDAKILPKDVPEYQDRFAQAAASRRVAVMGQGLDYSQISINPEESQFLETIKFTGSQVASIYHLPPDLVGGQLDGSSLTYQNIEMRLMDIARFALMPYISRIEQMVYVNTPRPRAARFNMNEFQRPDMQSRYQSYALALGDQPFLRVDEVRAMEHLAPMPKPNPATAQQGTSAAPDSPDAGEGASNDSDKNGGVQS